MSRPSIHISIPKPCHEQWDSMTATGQGAFCQSCQTEVIDFSTMTDREVVEYLSKNKTGCGRFRNDQLNTKLSIPSVENGMFKWRALLLGILPFFGAKTLEAVPQQKTYSLIQSINYNEQPTDTAQIKPQAIDSFITFSGRITDEKGEGLINARICLLDSADKPTQTGVLTDIDGNYILAIPKDKRGKSLSIQISYIGYSTQILKGISATEKRIINAKLEENTHTMTLGIMIYTPRTPAQKMRYWFRHTFRIRHKH